MSMNHHPKWSIALLIFWVWSNCLLLTIDRKWNLGESRTENEIKSSKLTHAVTSTEDSYQSAAVLAGRGDPGLLHWAVLPPIPCGQAFPQELCSALMSAMLSAAVWDSFGAHSSTSTLPILSWMPVKYLQIFISISDSIKICSVYSCFAYFYSP